MTSKKKSVVLQFVRNGGLGNQMFEYAAGFGIAKRLGLPLVLSWMNSKTRKFELSHFGIRKPSYIRDLAVHTFPSQGGRESVEYFVEALTQSKKPSPVICNCFQSEECFDGVADEIRRVFQLAPHPLENRPGTTPVGVQVRRGDYLRNQDLNVCGLPYFVNATRAMAKLVPHPHFYVVSDDPDWCGEAFQHWPNVTVMSSQSAIDDMRVLTSCAAHIISNSTFGWWGAWLGEKGPVMVPEIWHRGMNDYGNWCPAPQRWLKISINPPA